MKITYLFHSGFLIEAEHFNMIIDYYPRIIYNFDEMLRDGTKPLYVLSTHRHHDHFDDEIFKLGNGNRNVKYILSSDIESDQMQGHDVILLSKGNVFEDQLLSIQAYGSTDIGVSFLISAEGKRFFHAGDLYNWHWKDTAPPETAEYEERMFLLELEDIAKDVDYVDFAMFLVDPRLGGDYDLGAKQFVDRIKVGLFIPMHFGYAYDEANQFKVYAESKGCRFATINAPGDVFTL